MIKKLRRKFVATSMLMVSVVLFAVFVLQLYTAYKGASDSVQNELTRTLRVAETSLVPRLTFRIPNSQRGDKKADSFVFWEYDQSADEPDESPSSASYSKGGYIPSFSVVLDENGTVTSIKTGIDTDVDEETAQALVDAVIVDGGSGGSLIGQSLSYAVERGNDGSTVIAFADNSSVIAAVSSQALTTLLICLGALAAFYLLSIFLAKTSLNPVERAWTQQRQFVADVSHELKTPLSVILTNADLVLSHPQDTVAEQEKWVGYIRDEAQQMRQLVEDLLFLAKSDASKFPQNPKEVDFSVLVLGSILPFESVAFEQGVEISEQVPAGLTIRGDEAQLRRLVIILLDNAVKYSEKNGSVCVKLDEQSGKLILSVHNTGEPIPAEHLPHLFERFYRVDKSRTHEEGSYGLGLAIAKSIVDAHCGRITVESDTRGTVFTVLLPRKL